MLHFWGNRVSQAWKNLDLEGEGLQKANLRLVQLMKKRGKAYALLAAYPMGLHRSYLEDSRGAWAYRLASMIAIGLLIAGFAVPALAILGLITAFALYDIRWIEDRVAALNKRLKMGMYMKQAPGAPRGFKGRYTDDGLDDYLKQKEQERGGHQPAAAEPPRAGNRAPSFAEQERMLQELAKSRSKKSE